MATLAMEADTRELVEELRRSVTGEVRFDKMTRMLYSTDASIYQIEPVGVVLPKSADDVIAVLETAHRYNLPVLPRGGGTSLAGQTVANAIVMDFSRHMRDVLEVNEEEGWVRAQPGIILDELNHKIASSGMFFTPDPSTSSRGNVGGALGNNSCGAHSIIWGKTVDNVESLDVVLSNGDRAHFGALDGAQLESRMRGESLEGDIYRKLLGIGEAHRNEILARYPKIQRRVSGYNLDEFVGGSDFNMARFVVGSEGTLVTITEAKLKLVKKPKLRAISVIHFNDLIESMEATVATLEMEPAAVELIGSMIIRQARSNLAYSRMTDFIEGDPEALLVVEMIADSEPELMAKLERLEARVKREGMGYAMPRLIKPSDQAKVWDVRKAGLGLMMNVPGDAKPLPFVEDTAVSPEKLPQFVKRFDEIVRAHGTEAGYYGHASVGCLHIRPLINLKESEGVSKMVSISDEISDLVLEYGGSLSGEHGDGLVRSPYNEKMFGSQIYEAFRDVKRAFDPDGIMNPGKIVDSPPMTNSLRISPQYKPIEIETAFAYKEEGSFAHAIEMCNGQGACRKVLGGTMCPSYMVTRDEEHSTRGRANALRGAMSGALPHESLTSERMMAVMDLCLECKGCKAECPSNVDMAKLKYEFIDKYKKKNGYSLRDRLMGDVAFFNKLASPLAPLTNLPLKSAIGKEILERYAGIDKRRELPMLASQTFRQWFRASGGSPASDAKHGTVVLFPDTFTNYNHPELGIAAVKVLRHLGYRVVLPEVRCCGRPMLSKGFMDKAKASARANVESVYPLVEQGAKLVGLEPSCILSFSDEYEDLLGGDAKAKAIAENTMLIEEFLLYAQEDRGAVPEYTRPPGKVLFHGHCHQKALVGTRAAMQVLNAIPGCEATEIQTGCCGMAGSFGLEKEHYDISMSIGEMALFPAVRAQQQQGEFELVMEGVSCRQQVEHGTGKKAKHLVELLAEAI